MSNSALNIVLFGPPGSGKGTQAVYLARKYDLSVLTMSSLIRRDLDSVEYLSPDSIRLTKIAITLGKLVDDNIVCSILSSALKKTEGNFILDGFPRSLIQTQEFKKMLAESNKKISFAFELDISLNSALGRLSSRTACLECGVANNMLLKECINCGSARLMRREDDKDVKVMEGRLTDYKNNMREMWNYFEQHIVNITKINGELGVDQVSQCIDEIINNNN